MESVKKRGSYKTRQRDLILAYFSERGNGHITVDMIADGLKNEVGRTTVYRTVEKLVNEGALLKFDLPGGTCYQYLGEPDEHCNHYHLLCVKCGEVAHTNCEFLDGLAEHVLAEHDFSLNKLQTVLYGNCVKCR